MQYKILYGCLYFLILILISTFIKISIIHAKGKCVPIVCKKLLFSKLIMKVEFIYLTERISNTIILMAFKWTMWWVTLLVNNRALMAKHPTLFLKCVLIYL